ncbi:MAG TPA: hypothetical protein VNX68_04260, partial [Nitrosopumilaceae archaeon]|nr:hypothetical protein [Nitrosopumilaceae archaeon]
MGYRNYVGSITRKEYEKIKDFTKEELYKYKKEDIKDGYVGVYEIAKKEVYGFGKYCEFGDERFYKPVFTNKDLQENLTSEQDFYIVEKEFLAHIIKYYNEKIKTFYTELVTDINVAFDKTLDSEASQKKI